MTRKGGELSTAYDINPTLSDNQSLLINRTTSESNIDTLLASAGDYMLSAEKAKGIITEVKNSHEIVANRSPQTRSATTRHRHVRTTI